MEIKYTTQGLLIYLTTAVYLSASLLEILSRKKVAEILFRTGFAVAAVSFGYRWLSVRHVPFQNLFEVFVSMGMMIYPLSLFCRRVLRVRGGWPDMLLGAVVLIPAGFVFSEQSHRLPPALQCWLFAPHVAVYLLAYVIMAKAAIQGLYQLSISDGNTGGDHVGYEQGTYRLICFGFPLLTLGLIMGSCWGKLAWGDYWGWDPKELWSLASWLVYVGYFHFRYMFRKRYARANSLIAVLGLLMVVITLLWVNLSRLFAGLHSYAL